MSPLLGLFSHAGFAGVTVFLPELLLWCVCVSTGCRVLILPLFLKHVFSGYSVFTAFLDVPFTSGFYCFLWVTRNSCCLSKCGVVFSDMWMQLNGWCVELFEPEG